MAVKADIEGEREVRSFILYPTSTSSVAFFSHFFFKAGGVVNNRGNKCWARDGIR